MSTSRTLFTTVASPIGELLLLSDGRALRGLHMQEAPRPMPIQPQWQPAEEPFVVVREQLQEYFAGERTTFDVPLRLDGSGFQLQVWRELRTIPYGTTTSYGEIARRLGKSVAAARAVGLANGQNPISVIVPCHRVIGADGSLTGYGGGLERKRYLLDLEGCITDAAASQPRLEGML
jgi:methylated-DNA-[protein]-cysteine S-methyltransferase